MNNTDRNASIIALRKDGIGPREIARRMKVSPGVVAGVLDRARISSSVKSDEFQRRVVDDLKNGPSISAVARRWGVARTTVCGWIRASGVSA